MPRRNRRLPNQPARPVRTLTAAQRASLALFAREHLAAHAEAVEAWADLDDTRGCDPSLCVTGSEHPATGVRFVSAGNCPDRVAVRLATSDAARRVAT